MLLLALQTTATAASDDRIDTLTLVLVVLFIAAMLGLSLAIRREGVASPDEEPTDPALPVRPARSQPTDSVDVGPVGTPGHGDPALHRSVDRANVVVGRSQDTSKPVPVWLRGVTLPSVGASLSEATRVIEALLTARRDHDLAAGMALHTPSAREALVRSLGLDGDDSGVDAIFDGDPPSLRSAEIVEATGGRMTVRATYSNRSSELYVLIRVEQDWLIQDITSQH